MLENKLYIQVTLSNCKRDRASFYLLAGMLLYVHVTIETGAVRRADQRRILSYGL